jgi:hypothetical protein
MQSQSPRHPGSDRHNVSGFRFPPQSPDSPANDRLICHAPDSVFSDDGSAGFAGRAQYDIRRAASRSIAIHVSGNESPFHGGVTLALAENEEDPEFGNRPVLLLPPGAVDPRDYTAFMQMQPDPADHRNEAARANAGQRQEARSGGMRLGSRHLGASLALAGVGGLVASVRLLNMELNSDNTSNVPTTLSMLAASIVAIWSGMKCALAHGNG